MTVSAQAAARLGSPSGPDFSRREHRFFTRSTVVIAVLVLIGFGFSTYVRTRPGATAFGGPTLKPLVRAHAAVSTAWISLLVFQAFLVSTRRTPLHRRLGAVGGALAIGLVVLGWLVSSHDQGFPQYLSFFVLPFSELLMFSV